MLCNFWNCSDYIYACNYILLLFEKVIIKTSKGFIEPKKDNEQGNPVFAGNN